MCLITNQTKIICLTLYMQNYRWSKYDAMHCIPLIGLYNTPYYDFEMVGGIVILWNFIIIKSHWSISVSLRIYEITFASEKFYNIADKIHVSKFVIFQPSVQIYYWLFKKDI
jgi:hypothetical protein